MKNKIILICTALLFFINAKCQKSEEHCKNTFSFSPAISVQKSVWLEANVLYAYVYHATCAGPLIKGFRFGVESNLDKNHFVFAPKAGYEVIASLLCFRLSGATYLNKEKMDLRIMPEAGITLIGTVSLMYGRNIATLNYHDPLLTNNKITLSFIIHKDLWGLL